MWWLLVGAVALVGYWKTPGGPPPPPAQPVELARSEREAFLALSFGRLGDNGPEALPTALFQQQVSALKQAGYTSIRLDDVDSFLHHRALLPPHPLLLVFTEAQRDTMDIADATLASLDMRAVVFVNVRGLEEGNIDLVSRHRLGQLAQSGRWEVGVDGNAAILPAEEGAVPTFPADDYQRDRKTLEDLLERPVLAVAYQRSSLSGAAAEQAWTQTLQATKFPLGFVTAPPQTNYRDDSPFRLRSLKASKGWTGDDLVAQLAAEAPRREGYRDDFSALAPSPAWVVGQGDVTVEKRRLKMASREGQSGAAVSLAGSERWSDAVVTVELAEPPRGQFWVSLRGRKENSFARLGVVKRRAVLQTSSQGETHVAGSRDLSSRGSIVLRLRILGGRAVAEVNEERLSERPTEVPSELQQGPLTLAVWNDDGEGSALVSRVEAEPLPSRLALVSTTPDDSTWGELRRRAEEFTIVSPGYSSDRGRRRGTDAMRDSAIGIFTRYHYLRLFPALIIDHSPGPGETRKIIEEGLHSAEEPGVDGLNLVIDRPEADEKPILSLVSSLRAALAARRRALAVTVPGAKVPPRALEDLAEVFVGPREDPTHLQTQMAPLRLVRPPT